MTDAEDMDALLRPEFEPQEIIDLLSGDNMDVGQRTI